MNLQVLVSTMKQTDHSLLEKMNINSNAIVINQCNRNEIQEFDYKGNNIKFLSFSERGVGLSRNNALMRATGDICLLADDDVIYVDEYKNIILKAFIDNPKADMILFNVPSSNPDRLTYIIPKYGRVRWYNCQRYGAVKMAVRTSKLKQVNIYFSLLFGGGAKYSAGEDSLFISECIKSGLKVYTNPTIIGYVKQEESTWFKGYTDKYFIDKGAFYACLSPLWCKFHSLQFVIRHKETLQGERSRKEAFQLMLQGIKQIKDEK